LAAHTLAGIFKTAHQQGKIPANDKNTAYVEAYEMFRQFCADSGVAIKTETVELAPDRNTNVQRIIAFFDRAFSELEPEVLARKIRTETTLAREAAHKRYIAITGNGFVYELSESDFDQIQKLINHLRKLLQDAKEIDEKHRARLLERLEALQSELHRKMTSFEIVWGYFMETTYAIAQIGDSAKEIRKTIREIVAIISIAASVAYGLPSSTPPPLQLPEPKEGE
jgi:NifB/MoaA-like Fe-S oxidoreductase